MDYRVVPIQYVGDHIYEQRQRAKISRHRLNNREAYLEFQEMLEKYENDEGGYTYYESSKVL